MRSVSARSGPLYTQFNQYHVILEASPRISEGSQKCRTSILQNYSSQCSTVPVLPRLWRCFPTACLPSKNPCGLLEQRDFRGAAVGLSGFAGASVLSSSTLASSRSLKFGLFRQANFGPGVRRIESDSSNPSGKTGGAAATSASPSSPIPTLCDPRA